MTTHRANTTTPTVHTSGHHTSPPAAAAEDLSRILSERLPQITPTLATHLTETVYAELELRVGQRLSAGLTDRQLADFEFLLDSGDDTAASRWLTATVPHYRQIVSAVRDQLVDETVDMIGAD